MSEGKQTIQGAIDYLVTQKEPFTAYTLAKIVGLSRHRVLKYCKRHEIDIEQINEQIRLERGTVEDLGLNEKKPKEDKTVALDEVKQKITKFGFTFEDLHAELQQGKSRRRKKRTIDLPKPTPNKIKLAPPSLVKIKLNDEDD